MTIMLVIGLIVTAVIIVWLILAGSVDSTSAYFPGVILVFGSLIFYVVIGLGVDVIELPKEKIKVEIVKNSTTVFVTTQIDDKEELFKFKEYNDYITITDSTCVFYLTKHLNMYNCETSNYHLTYEKIK